MICPHCGQGFELEGPAAPVLQPEEVIEAVRAVAGVPDLKLRNRELRYTTARQAATILLRAFCFASLPVTAELLGWADHSSSFGALTKGATLLLAGDPYLTVMVHTACARLGRSPPSEELLISYGGKGRAKPAEPAA